MSHNDAGGPRPPRPEDAIRRIRVRLRRIAGQVSGIDRMVEEQRSCQAILTQVASVKQALNGLAAELLQAHLEGCVRDLIEDRDHKGALESARDVVRSALRQS